MGDPRKKRKQYEKPKKLWDKKRIEVESKLVEEYGLRNMRELWRTQTELRKIRREARRLLAAKEAGQEKRSQQLLDRAKSYIVRKADIVLGDLLSLNVHDLLARRLQTIIVKKHLAKSMKQARQFIVHGHIAVNGNKVTSPSYVVKFSEEDKIGWYSKPVVISNEEVEEKTVEEKTSDKEAEKEEAPSESVA